MQSTVYPNLDSQHVLVTGGATGIGADIVRSFAEQNCLVTIFDIQDDAGQDLADQLGQSTQYVHCDLLDTDTTQTQVHSIAKQRGALSVLVNNAANDDRRPIENIDADYWDWSQRINVGSQFFVAQAAYRSMKTLKKGSVINLSSIAWRLGIAELAAYATAKAGILGLTQSLAREFGQHNIRVNAIEPGAVMTTKQRSLWYPTDADVERMVNRQMLDRVIVGEDIARVVVFLASDDSAAITGQSIRVDSGFQ